MCKLIGRIRKDIFQTSREKYLISFVASLMKLTSICCVLYTLQEGGTHRVYVKSYVKITFEYRKCRFSLLKHHDPSNFSWDVRPSHVSNLINKMFNSLHPECMSLMPGLNHIHSTFKPYRTESYISR